MTGARSGRALALGQTASGEQRREAILRQLDERGFVQMTPLAEQLGVSVMTLRRDLEELEREGLLERIRGGAVRPREGGPAIVDTEEPEFQKRMSRALAAKEAMARVAADLLTDARALALDVGTSTLCLAREIAERRDLRVFTNNLRAAQLLADQGPEVYLAGGRVRPIEQAVGGPAALAQFDALWFDAAVIGVSGVCGNGFFDYSFEDADMKRVYFKRASRRIVLADSTKFNRRSLVEVGQLSEATDLITEAPPPAVIAQALEEAGVRLHLAPARGPGA